MCGLLCVLGTASRDPGNKWLASQAQGCAVVHPDAEQGQSICTTFPRAWGSSGFYSMSRICLLISEALLIAWINHEQAFINIYEPRINNTPEHVVCPVHSHPILHPQLRAEQVSMKPDWKKSSFLLSIFFCFPLYMIPYLLIANLRPHLASTGYEALCCCFFGFFFPL